MARGKSGGIGGIGVVEAAPLDDTEVEAAASDPGPPAVIVLSDEEAAPSAPRDMRLAVKAEIAELGSAVQQMIAAHQEMRGVIDQSRGQIQQLEAYVPQIQHMFATVDARLTGMAQQIARNVRGVALDLAIKASAGETQPTKIVDAARTFMEFLDPPTAAAATVGFSEDAPPQPPPAPTTH